MCAAGNAPAAGFSDSEVFAMLYCYNKSEHLTPGSFGSSNIMIKDAATLDRFERELRRLQKPDLAKNFKIVEALYDEAVAVGAIPLKDPLDGIEVDIKIAKAVNSVSKAP
jgi:hypothetical protein